MLGCRLARLTSNVGHQISYTERRVTWHEGHSTVFITFLIIGAHPKSGIWASLKAINPLLIMIGKP